MNQPKPSTTKTNHGNGVVKRYDNAGHIDERHARHLMNLANQGKDREPPDFLQAEATDALAEELGEEAVLAMTSGQDDLPDERDAVTAEEAGGPFVPTSPSEEFADGTDDSNIDAATREPFPTT